MRYFKPISPVDSAMLLVNCKSGSLPDCCLPDILKSAVSIVNPILNKVLNASLESTMVLKKWKQVLLLLLFKKPNAESKLLCNFRPISLFPAAVKVLEKTVNKQILVPWP